MPEFAVAHLQIARENIAGALTRTVEREWLQEEQALSMAADWLFNNPSVEPAPIHWPNSSISGIGMPDDTPALLGLSAFLGLGLEYQMRLDEPQLDSASIPSYSFRHSGLRRASLLRTGLPSTSFFIASSTFFPLIV